MRYSMLSILPTFIGQSKSCDQAQSKGWENTLCQGSSPDNGKDSGKGEILGSIIQLITDVNEHFFECL